MSRPTFIGIGAQKCASTWLYAILEDHPEAVLSKQKEVDFFSYNYGRGFQWYERHFQERAGTLAYGEVSPSYFHEPAVPERVKNYAESLRIILFLRDPVERAISNHKHEVKIGNFQGNDIRFEAGLANNPTYIDQGLYATHLSRWLKYFSLDQFLIILYQDIANSPETVAKRVYRFIGVDDNHRSAALSSRSNVSELTRFQNLDSIRKILRMGVSKIGLGPFWEFTANAGARKIYRKFNRMACDEIIPSIPNNVIRELRQQFMREIDELEQLLGVPLEEWRGKA